MYRPLPSWLSIVAFGSGALAQSSLSTTCYYKTNGTEHMSDGGPCGVVSSDSAPLSCCAVGDMCLEDGLCHYTHAFPTNGSATGFYVGGCTDQGLDSDACNSACAGQDLTDAFYNHTTSSWHCCGATNGIVHCNNPTSETFTAPGPSNISTTYTVLSQAATTAPTPTSSAGLPSGVSAVPAPSDNTSTKHSSGGLSTGAKAGIGIACAIIALALIAGIIFFILRRRKNKRGTYSSTATTDTPQNEGKQPATEEPTGGQGYFAPVKDILRDEARGASPAPTYATHEMGDSQVHEMFSDGQMPHELKGNEPVRNELHGTSSSPPGVSPLPSPQLSPPMVSRMAPESEAGGSSTAGVQRSGTVRTVRHELEGS